jgi:hypothetical protein
MKSNNFAATLTLAAALSLPVVAAEQPEWHGFIAQGLAQASDSNAINNSGKLSAALTEIGINSRWQLTEQIRVAGQVVYLNGGNRYPEGARLDYLFVDLSVIDTFDHQLNLYAGRYKNQHWLFSSTRDVPFTRPSIILPQSVYYDTFRDIAVGSDGIAIKGFLQHSLGELEYNWSYGATSINAEQSQLLLSPEVGGKARQKYVHQASVFWQPAGSQATYGISLLDSEFNYRPGAAEPFSYGEVQIQRAMLNWRYQLENWELAAELMQERLAIDGFYLPGFSQSQSGLGGYLLAKYRFNQGLSFISSVDYLTRDKDDKRGSQLEVRGIPAHFGYQQSLMLGLSYDVAANWRLQAEHHWVDGTGRLSPSLVPDLVVNQQRYWQVWALQLMYWF